MNYLCHIFCVSLPNLFQWPLNEERNEGGDKGEHKPSKDELWIKDWIKIR